MPKNCWSQTRLRILVRILPFLRAYSGSSLNTQNFPREKENSATKGIDNNFGTNASSALNAYMKPLTTNKLKKYATTAAIAYRFNEDLFICSDLNVTFLCAIYPISNELRYPSNTDKAKSFVKRYDIVVIKVSAIVQNPPTIPNSTICTIRGCLA